jgi:MFS family permease
VLTQLPLRRWVGRRLFIAVGIFGLAAILFGASSHYWLSALAVFVMGAADMVSVYVRGTLVPLATPDALRGRVIAVEAVFISGSNELGGTVAGSAAALLGPIGAVIAGGSLTLAVTLIWSRMFPVLRNVDRFEDVHAK